MRERKDINLPHLQDKFLNAFSTYLKDDDRIKLIKSLRDIEDFEKQRSKYRDDESLWFRFFRDETSCWTVGDVLNDLKNVTNKAYVLQNMKLAIQLKSMEIYYS